MLCKNNVFSYRAVGVASLDGMQLSLKHTRQIIPPISIYIFIYTSQPLRKHKHCLQCNFDSDFPKNSMKRMFCCFPTPPLTR